MDMSYLVNQIKAVPKGLRLRQGKVITVNTNRTMDVQIAGDTNTLPSVRYLSNYAPKPQDQVWLLNDGADLLGIGMIASANRTLAPVAYRQPPSPLSKMWILIFHSRQMTQMAGIVGRIGDPTKLTAPITDGTWQRLQFYGEGQNSGYAAVFIEKGTQEIARQDGELTTKEHGLHLSVTSVPITLTKGNFVRMGVHHDFNP
jgi:hypothetical protein